MSFACAAAAAPNCAFHTNGGAGGIESAPHRQPLFLRLLTGVAISGARRASGNATSFLQETAKKRQTAIYIVPLYKKDNVMLSIDKLVLIIARLYKDK